MAWTFSMLNDDTTLALNDMANYAVKLDGFSAPSPPRLASWGGATLFRHGEDLIERVFRNRTVTLDVWIIGTSQDNLIANINAIHQLLDLAADFSKYGLHSQVKLRRQWDSGTNQVDFHVIAGVLDVPDETSVIHSKNSRVSGRLTLVCKPFAYGAQETASNHIKDPMIEVAGTALADWTDDSTATGTGTRDTTKSLFNGAASLKLAMTNSGAGQQWERRHSADITVVAAEVWSFGAWAQIVALSDAQCVFMVEFLDGSGNEIARWEDFEDTTSGSDFIRMKWEGLTVPTNATVARVSVSIRSTAASATGEVNAVAFDAEEAATLPTLYVSGRDIANHYDDDGQDHINYLDIYGIQGDVPAPAQLKLAENEAHQDVWVGARHAGRQKDANIVLEGEDGSTTVIHNDGTMTETADETEADATASDGNANRNLIIKTGVGISAADPDETWFRTDFTIATPPLGQYRVLARVANGGAAANAANEETFLFGMGWKQGAVELLDQTNPDISSFVPLTAHGAGAPGNDTSGLYQLLDLGVLTVPVLKTPDGQTAASFILQIYQHAITPGSISNINSFEFYIDYVLLMPIDFGALYLNKDSAQDVVLLDSLSVPSGAWLLNTSDVVQSFPSNQLGSPILVHPSGTRIYTQTKDGDTDAAIADGYKATLTVQPLYLYIRGDD